MKMLLHVCCGPCASGVIPYWKGKGVDTAGFFYNPNVHPFLEFRRRLEGAKEVCHITDTGLTVDDSYDPSGWFEAVSGEGETRCYRCIALRLDRTAGEALKQGCVSFSTTLAVSPWQDHDAIRQAGSHAGAEHGVEFVYQDLRGEYAESRRLSREWGIYRQKYCGCLVSEWERYRDRKSTKGSGSQREST